MKKPNQNFLNTQFNKNWTLFLDRDGVINERLIGDYVKSVEEFVFCKGAIEAIATFTKIFGKIIVITNQQGIGKTIMGEKDLLKIHQHMSAEIKKYGGLITDIFYCPDLASKNQNCRKPNPIMAHKAKERYPSIDFNKSLMIGDSESDMTFADNVGCHALFISPTMHNNYHTFPSLIHIAKKLLHEQTKITP